MNNSLNIISKSTNTHPIVALHPRSNYNNKPFKFDYPAYINQTFELVNNSKIVVMHYSTSIQWAILLRKPILVLTTDELEKSRISKHINLIAKELDKQVINLDHLPPDFNFNDYLEINDDKYQKYIENYIKIPGTQEKMVCDIIMDRIESDYVNCSNP